MQDETVGNWQLWLAAEAIVVGKFGIYAVWRELQRVRDDAIATKGAKTMNDKTVGDGWNWERIDIEMEKAYKAHADTYQFFWVRELLRRVCSDMTTECVRLNTTIATQTARIEQQDSDWLAMMKAIVAVTDNEWTQSDDATLLEQFDPWQALHEINYTIATQAARIEQLEALIAYIATQARSAC